MPSYFKDVTQLIENADYTMAAILCFPLIEKGLRQVLLDTINELPDDDQDKQLICSLEANLVKDRWGCAVSISRYTFGQIIAFIQKVKLFEICKRVLNKEFKTLINLQELVSLRNELYHVKGCKVTRLEAELLFTFLKNLMEIFDLHDKSPYFSNLNVEPSDKNFKPEDSTKFWQHEEIFNKDIDRKTSLISSKQYESELKLLETELKGKDDRIHDLHRFLELQAQAQKPIGIYNTAKAESNMSDAGNKTITMGNIDNRGGVFTIADLMKDVSNSINQLPETTDSQPGLKELLIQFQTLILQTSEEELPEEIKKLALEQLKMLAQTSTEPTVNKTRVQMLLGSLKGIIAHLPTAVVAHGVISAVAHFFNVPIPPGGG